MKNLLLNGYINENYSHYISLFHEGSISKADYDFERNVKSGISSKYDFKLKELRNLIKRVPVKYFGRKEILNYNLLNFFLANDNNYDERKNRFLNLISGAKKGTKEAEDYFLFLDGYLKKMRIEGTDDYLAEGKIPDLISEISWRWIGFWDHIMDSSNKPQNELDEYLRLIVNYAKIEGIELQNSNGNLSAYISRSSKVLDNFQKNEFISQVLQKLGIKFQILSKPNEKSKELFKLVYEINSYEINLENCRTIVEEFRRDLDLTDFLISNYSVIRNSNCDYLINYLKKEINVYVTTVLLNSAQKIKEDEEAFIELLNNKSLKDELKIKLIKKQDRKLSDLTLVENNDLLNIILEESKLVSNWKNIFTLYKNSNKEISKNLINYLNKSDNAKELAKIKLDNKIIDDDEELKSLTSKILKCQELNFASYSLLVESTFFTWKGLSVDHLDVSKMKLLIDKNKLSLEPNNFNMLKADFPNHHIRLIEKNHISFLSSKENLLTEGSDYLLFFSSLDIPLTTKAKIFRNLQKSFILTEPELAGLLCELIPRIKVKNLDFDVLKIMMKNSTSTENKIRTFNLNFNNLTRTQVEELIKCFPQNYQRLLKKQHKPKFPKNDYNKELLDNLAKNNFIIRYEVTNKTDELRAFANY